MELEKQLIAAYIVVDIIILLIFIIRSVMYFILKRLDKLPRVISHKLSYFEYTIYVAPSILESHPIPNGLTISFLTINGLVLFGYLISLVSKFI